jgi:hypothetical protein
VSDDASQQRMRPTPEQLYAAVFCNGDEAWFDPTSLAAYIGAPVAAIQDALTQLTAGGGTPKSLSRRAAREPCRSCRITNRFSHFCTKLTELHDRRR